MRVAIVIYSAGRAETAVTPLWLFGEDVFLCVLEHEKDEYSFDRQNKIAHPSNIDRLYKKIDWVWDKFKANYDAVVKIDDDILFVRDNGVYLNTDENITEASKLTAQEFIEICRNMCVAAKDMKTCLWGFGSINKFNQYNPSRRFRFLKAFDASVMGYVYEDTLRVDHSIIVKNEYDLQLQTIRKYGRILVDNRYRQIQKSMHREVGGLSVYRNTETIEASKRRLKNKWGSAIQFGRNSVVFEF